MKNIFSGGGVAASGSGADSKRLYRMVKYIISIAKSAK